MQTIRLIDRLRYRYLRLSINLGHFVLGPIHCSDQRVQPRLLKSRDFSSLRLTAHRQAGRRMINTSATGSIGHGANHLAKIIICIVTMATRTVDISWPRLHAECNSTMATAQ